MFTTATGYVGPVTMTSLRMKDGEGQLLTMKSDFEIFYKMADICHKV